MSYFHQDVLLIVANAGKAASSAAAARAESQRQFAYARALERDHNGKVELHQFRARPCVSCGAPFDGKLRCSYCTTERA
jgi:hypothetical protein